MSLASVLTAAQTVTQAITGVKQAYAYAPESTPVLPSVVLLPTHGTNSQQDATWDVDNYSVTLHLLLMRGNLPATVAIGVGFHQLFLDAFNGAVTLHGACDHCHLSDFQFAIVNYGGVEFLTLIWQLTIVEKRTVTRAA